MATKGMLAYVRGGIGNPIWLDVHNAGESPQEMTAPLVPGSVFNIEPGIYVPEGKFGISIEDTFWVDPAGKLVNLTANLPVEPDDIERVMSRARLAAK